MPRATAIALLLAAAALSAPSSAPAALIGQWHLDEVTTEETPDSSGSGPSLLTGAVVQPGGRFGNALFFDGDERARRANVLTLQPARVTAMAWVKATAPGTDKYVMSKSGDSGICNVSAWSLNTGASGGLRFSVWAGAGAPRSSPSIAPSQIWDGEWHAVAGTYDGANARFYVDGDEVGSGSGGAPGEINYAILDDPGFALADAGAAGCTEFFYTGSIDEARVYDRVLSAAEIGFLQTDSGSTPPQLADSPNARFSASDTTPRVGQRIRFNASASSSIAKITSYAWDFTGDGSPEARCPASTPLVDTRFIKSGTRTVGLRTTSADGTSSVRSLPMSVAAGGSRVRAAAIDFNPAVPLQTARCLPRSTTVTQLSNGGPPPQCRGSALQVGVVEAIGCLTETDVGLLPAKEFNVLYPYASSVATGVDQTEFEDCCDKTGGGARKAGGRFTTRELRDAVSQVGQALTHHIWIAPAGQAVRINGLDFRPVGDAHIVLLAGAPLKGQGSYLTSSRAEIWMGKIKLKDAGVVKRQIDFGRGDKRIASFQLPSAVKLIPGFDLTGTVSAKFSSETPYVTRIAGQLDLPTIFRDANGQGLSTRVDLTLRNSRGLALDGLEITIPEVWIGGIEFFLHVKYEQPATVDGTVRMTLTPASLDQITGHVRLQNGSPKDFSLDWQAGPGNPGILVGPEIHMIQLGGNLGFDPFNITGSTTLSAGPPTSTGCGIADVKGTLFIQPDPFVFSGEGKSRLMCLDFGANAGFEVTGDLKLNGTNTLKIHGGLNYTAGDLFSFDANLNAAFQLHQGQPHMQAGGNANACIFDRTLCIGGDALVSDRGAAFCATLFEVEFLGETVRVRGGVGFDWPPPETMALGLAGPAGQLAVVAAIISRTSVMAAECDVGPWRTVAAARAAGAGGDRSFEVTEDEPALAIAVDGDGDAPKVTLRGPGGRQIVAPDTGRLRTGTEIAARAPSQDITYFVIAKPAKGTWTIQERGGSANVTRVRQAHTRKDPNVKGDLGAQAAAARGTGIKVLTYSLRPIPGQRVTFREIGKRVDRVIGVRTKAKGKIRFRPAAGPAGKRRIVAFIEQNGSPRDQAVVARFTYRQTKLSKPPNLRVKRRGKKLVVTFGRVRGADIYNVSVRLSDGRKRFFLVRRKPKKVRIGGLAARTRATVLVSAQRAGERRGKIARAKLKAKKKRR